MPKCYHYWRKRLNALSDVVCAVNHLRHRCTPGDQLSHNWGRYEINRRDRWAHKKCSRKSRRPRGAKDVDTFPGAIGRKLRSRHTANQMCRASQPGSVSRRVVDFRVFHSARVVYLLGIASRLNQHVASCRLVWCVVDSFERSVVRRVGRRLRKSVSRVQVTSNFF